MDQASRIKADPITEMRNEFKRLQNEAAEQILLYILDEQASELVVQSNDGTGDSQVRDRGNSGRRLSDFAGMEQARTAGLKEWHVAALRVYTSWVFKLINGPLRAEKNRNGFKETHPLAATLLLIYEALKMLRGVHAGSTETVEFWRGMKDLVLDEGYDNFMLKGGTELGCMSTSVSKDIIGKYSQSGCPLIFRVVSDGFMSRGADISWLSLFPTEKEVLYPPLTYLRPIGKVR